MGFLEEIEIFKKERKTEADKIEIEQRKIKSEIKDKIRNTIKEIYVMTLETNSTNYSYYYLNKAIVDIEGDAFSCSIAYDDVESIFLELYEELKDEIYIKLGYVDPSLKSIKHTLNHLLGKNSFPYIFGVNKEITGIYLKINPRKSKDDSVNNINTDRELASIEYKKIQNQIKEIENKEIQDKEKIDKTVFNKIKKFFKRDK